MTTRTYADLTVNNLRTITGLRLASESVLPNPLSRPAGSIMYWSEARVPVYSTGQEWWEMGGSGPSAYSLFIYAPNLEANFSGQGPNVFASWAELVAALPTGGDGLKYIAFSDRGSGSTGLVIPAGTWDLTDCVFWAPNGTLDDQSTNQTVTVSTGNFFNGLRGIDGPITLSVEQLTASGPVMLTTTGVDNLAPARFYMDHGARIVMAGAATTAFLGITTGTSMVVDLYTNVGLDGAADSPVFLLSGVAGLTINKNGPVDLWDGNVFAGNAGGDTDTVTMNIRDWACAEAVGNILVAVESYTNIDTITVNDDSDMPRDTFVFAPNAVAPLPAGTFNSWYELVATHNATNNGSVVKRIQFQTDGGAVTIPNPTTAAAVYNMSNTMFYAPLSTMTSGATTPQLVTLAAGVRFLGLLGVDGPLNITYNTTAAAATSTVMVTTAAAVNLAPTRFFLLNYAQLTAAAGADQGFLSITGTTNMYLVLGENVGVTGTAADSPCFGFAAGATGTLTIDFLGDIVAWDANSIAGGSGAETVVFNLYRRPVSVAVSFLNTTYSAINTLTVNQKGVSRVNTSTSAPAAGNDLSQGYAIGDTWVDTDAAADARYFFCFSAASGAATWAALDEV